MQFSVHSLLRSLAFFAALGLVPLSSGNDFSRMSEQLDTDGEFLAYVDLRGDAETFGAHLTEIYMAYLESNPDAMPVPLDFTALFRQTGLAGVDSLGYSSREIADDLYRNRGVVLLEGEPAGLLNIYDLTPRTFRAAEIAPPDASIAMDLRLDLVALRDTLTEIATSIMGPMGEGMIQGGLQHELTPSGLTGDDLLAYLSNSLTIIARQHLDLETSGSIDFYVEINEAAPLLDELIALSSDEPTISVQEVNGETVVDLSSLFDDANAGIGLFATRGTGDRLLLYSGADFRSSIATGERLSDTAAFQRLAENLPAEAAAFSFQKTAVFEEIFAALAGQPDLESYLPLIELTFDRILADFVAPQASAYYAIDGGMVADTYAEFSMKEMIVALPVAFVGGMSAAMAVPAYQKVQQTSQEKAVMNNLRQFASAAQQYMLENGVREAAYSDIVGPGKHISEIEPVAGENYEELVVTAGDTEVSVQLEDGRVVTYRF